MAENDTAGDPLAGRESPRRMSMKPINRPVLGAVSGGSVIALLAPILEHRFGVALSPAEVQLAMVLVSALGTWLGHNRGEA